MKKILLLVSLVTVLSSCGGGGGGGSTTQTSSATPVGPDLENKNTGSGNINSNAGNVNTGIGNTGGINNENNNAQSVQPQNTGSGAISQTPGAKFSDSEKFTGKGVKVGVLDSDFLSGDTQTKSFHSKIINSFEIGDTFNTVIEEEFGTRMIAIDKTLGPNSILNKSDHGLIVSTILAGKNGNGAKGATVYGVSFGEANNSLIIDKSKYEELYNNGVRIFNQSFGVPNNLSKEDNNLKNANRILGPSALREKEAALSDLIGRIEEVTDFYKMAVRNGALFVWAAGNTTAAEGGGRITYTQPSFQAGMPTYHSELHKGWIAVVGVRPDGTEYNPHLAWAGDSKWWSIAANGNCELERCSSYGSSFAAPRVTATAAKIKEKFPWMTGHEIQQTILTTATDIGQPDVDGKFGWGLLNEEKALKGPAKFSRELLVGERAANAGLSGQFNANIGDNITSTFENNITGLGGLKKSGNGTLILAGNNDYQGSTDIESGTLIVQKENGSPITIKAGGTLITTPTTVIGLKNYYTENFSPVNVKNEGGTLENRGSGAVITGDYTATAGSVTKAEIGTKLTVKGTVNLNQNNTTLQTLSNRKYITAKTLSSTVIEAEKGINGNFDKVKTPELINGAVETVDNKVNVKLSRKNMVEYVEKIAESDKMQKNTAQNLETAFQKLDQSIENGTAGNIAQFERKAAALQALTSSNRAAILDSLSGQIYASAQALTFQHSQTVNKDLSNRLVMLGTLDNVGDNFGLWVSSLGASGRLEQSGYGKGNTKVFGGQVGVDRKFGESLILGTALSYSKAGVKFNRYGGKSDASNFGVSLYGRLGDKEIPWYLQGRFGVGFVDSDVERDIILSSNDYSRAKINHNDKVYSGYVETGYDIKNSNGDFVVTPFAGITHDTVTRGSFSEDKSQFGLKAGKKNYSQTSALAGVRVGKAVQWNGESKTTFQGYVTHQRAFNDEDLSFKAEYSGLPGASFKVKGIGLSKNRTRAGVGALTEVNSRFGWYVNYDGSIDGEKSKGNNNIITTGLRFNF
ncbi:autotransporter domain-containing protein [Leptotrichia alba]|uniref:Autotransporter domain-containing protein n=1 Tax=Leptotrichia alba TaxID=3239304 RepID=A0AB39V2S0_9FUSO